MIDSRIEARRSRRWVAISALAIACGLVGAAVVLITAPAPAPTAVVAPLPVVASAPAAPASDWSTLTPAEQRTLSPLQPKWDALDGKAKARWIAVADRLEGKPSRAAARAAQHMDAWQHLSASARAQARLHYVMASRMPAAERRRRWDTYQATPHPKDRQGEAAPTLTMVSPSSARDRIGTTTVLLTDIRPGVLPLVHVRAGQAPLSAPAVATSSGDAS
jgi:hypothetical protein